MDRWHGVDCTGQNHWGVELFQSVAGEQEAVSPAESAKPSPSRSWPQTYSARTFAGPASR
jgi:hypothetical protein